MAFKALIAAIWLAVPLAAAMLLRADMQRFDAESAAQRAVCESRAELISHHAALLRRTALDLGAVQDDGQLQQWRTAWRGVERGVKAELKPLAPAALQHCPASAALLTAQEQELRDLQRVVDGAAKDAEYELRGNGALMDMAEQIDHLHYQSAYYRMLPNGRGVWLFLQEELAKLEKRYDTQQDEQYRLRDAVRHALDDVDLRSDGLMAALLDTPDLVAQDASQTYSEDVRSRWEDFDLRERLVALLAQRLGGPASGRT